MDVVDVPVYRCLATLCSAALKVRIKKRGRGRKEGLVGGEARGKGMLQAISFGRESLMIGKVTDFLLLLLSYQPTTGVKRSQISRITSLRRRSIGVIPKPRPNVAP